MKIDIESLYNTGKAKIERIKKSRVFEACSNGFETITKTCRAASLIWSVDNASNAHVFRDFVASVLESFEHNWRRTKIGPTALRCIKLGAALSTPFAIHGIVSGTKDIKKGNIAEGALTVIASVGWLFDSAVTTISGIMLTNAVSEVAMVALQQLVLPFTLVGAVCNIIMAAVLAKTIKKYDQFAKNLKVEDFASNTFKTIFGKEFKPEEKHLETYRKRIAGVTGSYKLKLLAGAVSLVGLAVLLAVPGGILVPTIIVAVGSTIQLGSVIYDKWTERKFNREIEAPRDGLNNAALVTATVAMVAIPAIIVSPLIK